MYILPLNRQNCKISLRRYCFPTIQQPEKDRCFEDEAYKYGEDVDLLSLLDAALLVREQFLEGFGNLIRWSSFYEDSVVRVSSLSIAASSMVGRSLLS